MNIRFFTILTSLLLAACAQNEGDGKGDVTLSLQSTEGSRSFFRTAISGIPVKDVAGDVQGTIDLTDAWVLVKEIEFEHEDDEETADSDINKLEFIGPYMVDLLTGVTYPELPQISIDTGLYTDIEMDIEKLNPSDRSGLTGLDSGVADTLEGYSLYLSGTYTEGSTTVDFTLYYDQTDEFEFSAQGESTKGFVIDDTGLNDIIVAFRLNEWFRFDNSDTNNGLSVSFPDASADIVLDANTNDDVMDVIEDNIEDSAEYGEDDDDDGQLSDDEDDD